MESPKPSKDQLADGKLSLESKEIEKREVSVARGVESGGLDVLKNALAAPSVTSSVPSPSPWTDACKTTATSQPVMAPGNRTTPKKMARVAGQPQV
jgi:hypothetical protein